METLAKQYVASVTGSSGQLCTSPGLVFVPAGEGGERFAAAVTGAISELSGQTMLSGGIASAWQHGHDALEAAADVEVLGRGQKGPGENAPAPAVFSAELDVFINNPVLHEEIFGAASLVVRYKSIEDLIEATSKLEGQLTASLHITEDDYTAAARLIPTLERKGRPHHRQRLAHRRRGRPRSGPRRPLPGHVRFEVHLRGIARYRPLPAPGGLPKLPRPAPPRGTAGRQPMESQPAHRRQA
ncbi:hypothetical protein ABIC98_002684 [Arthrobacter nitrophenolicus]|uniref:Uncharacterized protein n=1 Tax=Arthrobacter nitrophenolicus TaxID=683150 RepID=A0ACC6TH39_9MICC